MLSRLDCADEQLAGGALLAAHLGSTAIAAVGEHGAAARYTWYSPGRHELAFTADECDKILAGVEKWPEPTASCAAADHADAQLDVQAVTVNDEQVRGRIADAVAAANRYWFRYLLAELGETQALRYGTGAAMDWHTDSGTTRPTCKMAVSIQLSDPSEYDGGLLELATFGTASSQAAPVERGTVIVIPGTLGHQVTPVTRGVRYAFTAFIYGPPLQ